MHTDQAPGSNPLPTVDPNAAAQSTIGATVTRPRSTMVDAVRGMAILLVVVGHTSQGMSARGLWHGSAFAARLNAWMYAFHMPAFFFMAGLFLASSVAKRGTRRFLQDRASALLWPYAVSELLNVLLLRCFSQTSPVAHEPLRTLLWNYLTAAGAWFLPSLFFALAIYALLRRVPLPLLLLLSLVGRAYYQSIPVNFVASGLYFLPFVLLGAIVAGRIHLAEAVPRVIAVLTVVLLASAVWFGTGLPWHWSYGGGLVLAAAGIVMLVMAARLVEANAFGRWLAWCGEASLGIFLLAPYPQVAVRTLLLKLHVTAASVQLLVPSIAAALVGAWIYHNRDRLHVRWFFEFPGSQRASALRHPEPGSYPAVHG